MRKSAILLISILLIGAIAAAGCTAKQIPADNNQITATATPVKTATATAHAKPTVTPQVHTPAAPTPVPTIVPTATPVPVPPKPTPCTHVEIIIYHPTGTPCNTCAATNGELGIYYKNNPYVTVTFRNATRNDMIGLVKETGQTQIFDWGNVPQIEAWTNSVLTCK